MKLTDKVKLFVIDFDGTALGGYEPYERFPDNLSAFLDEISEGGVLWATCTTWHPYIQDRVFKASNLKTRPVRAIGRTSLSCGLYINGHMYLDAEWDHEMISCKAEFDREYLIPVREFLNSFAEEKKLTEYFDYIFSIEFPVLEREKITERFNSNNIIREKTYHLFLPDRKTVLIFPWYLSKGLAVRKVQSILGISPQFTMIAADGVNDLPMLERDIARLQVTPANADPEVKEKVEENGGIVSELPYSDGVVESARKLFNL
ncbi:MAG TPA: HAD hydrolase family protein [bacterium]|nr:HAD hydrolase family protein [bacterium]HPP30545.1 HAD hydrolase family protein [bacterium]